MTVREMTQELRANFEAALTAQGLPILPTDKYYKVVVIGRKDIDMRPGKFAAQAVHAGVMCDRGADDDERRAWDDSNQRVIAIKVGSKEELLVQKAIAEAAGIKVYVMRDAGLTQVEPHTMTCIGIGPAPIEQLDSLFRELKLY